MSGTADKPWVCLMYHDVAERAPASGGGEYFSVDATTFVRHLELLRDRGLEGCSISRALDAPDQRQVAISFDDGNFGQYRRAFPALVRAGMAATFFVTTSWIGRSKFVSWDDLREMRDAGMAIESHTHTHPFLSELPEDALREELRRSRDLLFEHLGAPPTMLALPGGDAPRPAFRRLFHEEGYRVVATSRWGMNPLAESGGVRFIRRCTVRGELDESMFVATIEGDSWLGLRTKAREFALGALRRSLTPTRYARWRRRFLDSVRAPA